MDWSKLYTLGRRLVRQLRPLNQSFRFSNEVANVAPLKECYCRDFGRPANPSEVMVRALLICSL